MVTHLVVLIHAVDMWCQVADVLSMAHSQVFEVPCCSRDDVPVHTSSEQSACELHRRRVSGRTRQKT